METNIIYCRDNLEFMKELPDKSIDLIYGDILYGTGNDFGEFQDLPANRDTIDEFYIPRIKEMYRLLKETGSIYLQMDQKINHWIRVIMDNIFGKDNFRNEIIWYYPSNGNAKSKYICKHDNILFYSKSDNFIFNYDNVRKEYAKTSKERYGRNWDQRKEYDPKINKNGKLRDSVWEISLLKGNSNEYVNYKTQKPKKLLKIIIKASSNKRDVIFDPFLGSGTTIIVAEELGRKWIGCDNSKKAISIAQERVDEVQKELI